MNSVAQVAETFQRILGEEADRLAHEVGFIQRERVLSGADFVQTLILGWLQEPEITLDGLTQVLQRREVSISASGLSQRFTLEAATLLQRVLERLCAEQMQLEPVDIALLSQFSAVIVEDSSSIVLPPELAEVWRGCGGSRGTSEAAVKLFVRWNVLAGDLQGPGLADGRRNDHRGPFAVEDLPDGCLYVADLGFFGVQRLGTIAAGPPGQPAVKRYFVSRYQPKTVLLTGGAIASSCAAFSRSSWASGWTWGCCWVRSDSCRCGCSSSGCPRKWPTSAANASANTPRIRGASPMRRCSSWPIGPLW